MKNILILIITLFFLSNSYGQSRDQDDTIRLDSILRKELSRNSSAASPWFYFPGSKIKKIDKPEIRKVFPEFTFYNVDLGSTNYEISGADCLILMDSSNSTVLVVAPMWYSDINEPFLKLFTGKKFESGIALRSFVLELQDLLNVGTNGKFENTVYAKE
jgi:hypothetical protein